MAKNKRQQKKKPPSSQSQRTTPRTRRQGQEEQSGQFSWIPLWGWILIFIGPLVLSEFMFYMAGRTASMILFPVAWIGFWIAIMHRSGWPIIKKRDEKHNEKHDDQGK
jgi:hypothetical protein